MDLFTRKCGCNRILRGLEQCAPCTELRRAEAIAKAGPKGNYLRDVPTAKLVEMVRNELAKDIQPVLPPRLLRPIIAPQPIPPLVEIPQQAKQVSFTWASPEEQAKAAHQTAMYQARHIQRRR